MEAPPSADLLPLLKLEDAREGPAPLDLLANPVLPLEDVEGAVRHLHGRLLGDHADPGLVPDDPVPGADDLAPNLDLAPDLPVALRLPRMGDDVAGEAREVDLEDRVDVPRGPVDHDARDALHLAGVAPELPPHPGRPPPPPRPHHLPRVPPGDRLPRPRPPPPLGPPPERP